MKILEESIGKILTDIGLGKGFLDMTPKAQGIKAIIRKWHDIKLKAFVQQRKKSTE